MHRLYVNYLFQREFEKHQFNESGEDESDEEEPEETIKLDDPEDEDYEEKQSRSAKRAAAKARGSYKKRDSESATRSSRYVSRGTKRGRPSNQTTPSNNAPALRNLFFFIFNYFF